MKKALILSVFCVAFIAFAGKASAQNGQSLEHKVRAAAIHCAQPYMTPHSDIYVNLVSTPRCIDGGTVYVYDVYVVYSCPPPHLALCLVLAPQLVATVATDCDGNISTVTCQ